jgi:Fur family peroxide stress response transcriptional regulator
MNYAQLLKQNELKATPQRMLLVEQLDINGHMNIDDIHRVLKQSFPTISLATIYKNINIMLNILFLSEVKIPHQKSVYELSKEEHSHVVCSKCNEIVDITLDTDTILSQASVMSSYSLDKSSIVFSGVCPKCQ